MFTRNDWSDVASLKLHRGLAHKHVADRVARYNWGGFSEAEIDAIYAEIIAKIPAGATKVLELGSGGGHFAQALRAARPGIGYRGVDLVIENVEAAQALLPAEEFVIGNVVEYLAKATMDWDFVVSIHCVFSCTDNRHRNLIFQLLDAKSPQGFILVGSTRQVQLMETAAQTAVGVSVGVAESYVSGDRNFLTDATLKNMLSPLLVIRESTPVEVPTDIPLRLCPITSDIYNKTLGRLETKQKIRDGEALPTTVQGVLSSEGLVTGVSDIAIDSDWVADLKTRKRETLPDSPDVE